MLKDRVATKDNLIKRGVTCIAADCPMCKATPENPDHVFARCSTTRVVSAHLFSWLDWWPPSATTVHDMWMAINSVTDGLRKEVGKTIMAAFFWTIWSQRNCKVFNGMIKKERVILSDIQFLAYDWIRCRSKFGKLLSWESWLCNPADAVSSCIALAPR